MFLSYVKRLSAFGLSILFVLTAALTAAVDKEQKQADLWEKLSLNTLKFRCIGPALTSGRISDFAVNPNRRSEYYVATSSGGVWKTINAGTTFSPIFDRQGSYSIGCITMDPNNQNVVWVGTGENNNQRSVSYGDGIYKTEDGGKNWQHMGLKKSEHIGMIAVDPRNSDVVYVAAYGPLWSPGGERGLYKTTDGGNNWETVLTISENTGVSEVHLDPRNPDEIYAVAHQRRRHVWTQISGGPESAVYKSQDAGATWKKINRGFPGSDLGRIALAISPIDPDVVFAIVEAKRGLGGFFRSTDRGASWEKRSSYHSSGNYYQELVCDPVDIDRVYSMDTFLQVTDDGGKTWRWLGEKSKHIDNHAMWIDPDDPDYYLVGSDGGVYESFDRGTNWKFMTNLPVTQFYKVAVDNAEPFYYVYGGTQDNYSLGGPSRTISAHGIVTSEWFTTDTGDGFESAIDPKDPNIIYAQSQYGGLARFDKKSGESLSIKPIARKGEKAYRWNWDAPLFVSPHSHTRIYFAANKVFRSDDRGSTWQVISDDLTLQIDRNKLKVMGRVWPMDAVAKNASTSQYGTIVALDESPLQEGLLYAGTDDGLIQITADGGATWSKIEKFPGVPDRTYVNEVLTSQHVKDTVYAAFNNHKNGDFKPYVLKSTDAGKTWVSIVSNLPERGSVYALAEDHVDPDLLFAGTEFGVFVTIDSGKHWKQLKNGLPTIAVRDIAIQKREADLVLATFGRGFYILDDYSPLRSINQDVLKSEAFIFPIKKALMFMESYPLGGLGSKDKGFQGEMYYSAKNPPIGATFTYYLKESVKTLREKRRSQEGKAIKAGKAVAYPTLEQWQAEEAEEQPFLIFTILDANNKEIRRLRSSMRAGLNRVVWDLKYPALNPTRSNDTNPSSSGPSSTFVPPGNYKVILSQSVNGEVKQLLEPVDFFAASLNNTSLPAADRAELAAFQAKVRKLSRDVNAAAAVVRELNTKIGHYRSALKSVTGDTSGIAKQIRALELKQKKLSLQLFGDRTLAQLDIDVEPGLTRRLSGIRYGHNQSTSAPTQQQQDNYQIVHDAFGPILKDLNQLLKEDVKQIEKSLDDIGAPYTPGRLPERIK